jgi:hypothetical protein
MPCTQKPVYTVGQGQVKTAFTMVYNMLTMVYTMLFTKKLVYSILHTMGQQQVHVSENGEK